MGRFQELIHSYPPTTLSFTVLCIGLYILSFFIPLQNYMVFCPFMFWNGYHIYTLFTFPYIHLDMMHILFNMMTLRSIGVYLESMFGSILFGYLMVLFGILGSIIYAIVGYFANISCVGGFSGVLFSLVTIDCFLSQEEQRSLYGLWNVSTQWYPVYLLIIIQILCPNVSFIGHLSGLIVGFLYSIGLFDSLVPMKLLKRIENSKIGDIMKHNHHFTPMPAYLPYINNAPSVSLKCKAISSLLKRMAYTAFCTAKTVGIFMYNYIYPEVENNENHTTGSNTLVETTYNIDGDRLESTESQTVRPSIEEVRKLRIERLRKSEQISKDKEQKDITTDIEQGLL
ncbi:hypothetical protein WA158_006389 [Blastocystis sp. Blastoise]